MPHKQNQSEDVGEDLALGFRTRIGVRLFLVYALVYGIFVGINLVSPLLMETIVLFGMNLAETYGIGLILFAVLLALIYNHMCAKKEFALSQAVSIKEDA
ncbi:MAG: hypothetical protein Q7J07_07125 [Pelolinea sp.]|nr:hypothetical protein [Pelolinea sp.]